MASGSLRSEKNPRTGLRGVARARDTGLEPVAFGSGGTGAHDPSVSAFVRAEPHGKLSTGLTVHCEVATYPDRPQRPLESAHRVDGRVDRPSPSGGVGEGRSGRLLSVREVAEHLSVSTATVYALVASGILEHVRVSNAIRVHPADLRKPLVGVVAPTARHPGAVTPRLCKCRQTDRPGL